MLKANNLSDVANATTSFNNISPLTTKGDLIGFSTQNVRLAVGMSDGQILQVSSAAATGLAWSTATYPVTTTANQILYSSATNTVTGLSSAVGGVLVTDASSVPSFLANPGASGKVLQSVNGAISAWSTPTYPSASGTSGKFIISDGTNNVYSTSTIPTSAGSTAGKIIVSDGTNYVLSTPTFPNASATSRKIIVSDGTNWIASTETYATPGTSGNVMTSNGTNWVSSPATGSGTVNTGLINQLAYYAAAGTAVSGLTIVNSAVLTTTSGGVPTWVAYTGTGAPVLGTAPTITSPLINAISDQTNNLPVMSFTGAVSAVNLIAAVASSTGNPVGFQFAGSDSNVFANYTTKGTGTHSFYNGLSVSTQPLFSISGAATNTVNYITASGTVTGSSPTLVATGSDSNIGIVLTSKGTGRVAIQGISTNTAAAAGYVGEFVSSVIANASAVSFSSGVSKDLTSISLGAGDWDVTGNITFTPTGTTLANVAAWISTTSATLPDKSLYNGIIFGTATTVVSVIAPTVRLLLSGTTTVYLSGNVGATTPSGCGGIYARRRS